MPTVETASGACASPIRLTSSTIRAAPEQRVLAARHRGRAGVALEPGQLDLVPALALPVRDDADVETLVFEDRPLLDVQFEEGVERPPADRLGPLEADPLQFVAERLAFRVRRA